MNAIICHISALVDRLFNFNCNKILVYTKDILGMFSTAGQIEILCGSDEDRAPDLGSVASNGG
jgi:hypothetical protein